MEVITYYLGGNSFPIVIQNDSKKYLVKLRAGLSGEYSLLSEWIGNMIGRSIGLNTRLPQWITLDESLDHKSAYVEVRDLITKSFGVNICFEYIDNAKEFDLSNICQIDKDVQIDIYLLDLLMLNIDRTTQNHNIICNETSIFITDYDSSLIFNSLIRNTNLVNNEQILQCLKLNPFAQNISTNQLANFLDKINKIDFNEIIFSIPNELLNLNSKKDICQIINSRIKVNWNLIELLENIENTKLETELEKNNRITKNRKKLEDLVRSAQNNL